MVVRGIYLLFFHLKRPVTKKVGSLRKIRFKQGNYIYVGSAQSGIESRVKRHISDDKRKHWHIDYILENSEILDMMGYEEKKKKECETASLLGKKYRKIEGFGCSDCRCDSHLFRIEDDIGTAVHSIREFKGDEDIRLKEFVSQ